MNINSTVNGSLSDFEDLAYPQSQSDQKKVDCNAKVRGSDDLSETKETSQSAQKSSQSNIPPDLDVEIVSVDFLADAEVEPGVTKTLEQQLQHAVKERHTIGNSIKNFFKKCGRGIMNAFSAIRGARSFYHAKSVAHFNSALNVTGNGSSLARSAWKDSIDYSKTVSYSDKELAAASGLRGNVEVKKFTADQIQSITAGNFRLSDIKQDPGLQDCWFLSSVGAFLAKGGSGSLSDLIHIPAGENNQPPEHAYVKLGTDVYKVPLGIVTGGGKKNISDSAPWVNLLETAMQMHLINVTDKESITTNGPRMAERNVQDAFAALQGVKHNGFRIASVHVKATLSKVRDFFTLGRPVVLASPKDAPFFALSTGISPGHAVTVVGVEQGKRPGDGRVTVLDPYGHTTVINEDDLQQFDMIAATPERCEKTHEADWLFEQAKTVATTDPVRAEFLRSQGRKIDQTMPSDDVEVEAAANRANDPYRKNIESMSEAMAPRVSKILASVKGSDLRSVDSLLNVLNAYENEDSFGLPDNVRQNVLDMIPGALEKVRNGGKTGDFGLDTWWKALGLSGRPPSEGLSAKEKGKALLNALYDKVCNDFINVYKPKLKEANIDVKILRDLIHPADGDIEANALDPILDDKDKRTLVEQIKSRFVKFLTPSGIHYADKLRSCLKPLDGITQGSFFVQLSPQFADLNDDESKIQNAGSGLYCLGRANGTQFMFGGEAIYTAGLVNNAEQSASAIEKLRNSFTDKQIVVLASAQNNFESALETSVGFESNLENSKITISKVNDNMNVRFEIPLAELNKNNEKVFVGKTMCHEIVIHSDGTSDCTGLEFVDAPQVV